MELCEVFLVNQEDRAKYVLYKRNGILEKENFQPKAKSF